jgi:hypothetical protein
VGYKFFVPSLAVFEIMSVFSIIELAAYSLCLLILWRYRNEDINKSSIELLSTTLFHWLLTGKFIRGFLHSGF